MCCGEGWGTSRERETREVRTGETLKSMKGFGYVIRKAKAKPSNTVIGDLLRIQNFTDAMLGFFMDIEVGTVTEGILKKD